MLFGRPSVAQAERDASRALCRPGGARPPRSLDETIIESSDERSPRPTTSTCPALNSRRSEQRHELALLAGELLALDKPRDESAGRPIELGNWAASRIIGEQRDHDGVGIQLSKSRVRTVNVHFK